MAEIAKDIGTALRALANAKIPSNATHPSFSTACYDRFCVQAARLQEAVRHEAGLEDVSVDTDSTAPYGLVIFCKRQLPPTDKARLKRLFHEYFPDRPAQQMDDMLLRLQQLRALDLYPRPSLPQKSLP